MVTKTVINPTVQAAIADYIARIKQKGILVHHAILFGSYAKGTQHQTSDIDLCIVSNNFGKDYHNELVELNRLTPSDIAMDVIPFHPDDLKEKYDSLASEIRQYGVRVL